LKALQSMAIVTATQSLITNIHDFKNEDTTASVHSEQSAEYKATMIDGQTVFIFELVSCGQSE
jgi:hypothetical protein